jgi:uncharacterized protein (DUF362 family)
MDVSQSNVTNSLKESILTVLEPLGGFQHFIKKNDRVLLKINLNTADPYPASSDLSFVRELTEIIYDRGAKEVIIGDSCTFSQSTAQVILDKKLLDMKNKMSPAPVIYNFDTNKRIKKVSKNNKLIKRIWIPEILDTIDKLIYVPCLKTHFAAQFTGSLKLTIGLLKKTQKFSLHLGHLQEKIAEINTFVKPDLIIMDGRKCFITKGPTKGTVKEPNIILASTSRVKIDIEGIKIIQKYKGNDLKNVTPEEMIQIKKSREMGIS